MEACDHKSVGVILENSRNEVLLLERARYPYGLAAPAGHVDGHGGFEQTAIEEVWEEVGITLPISALVKIVDNRRIENVCRRPGGDYHDWTVYHANIENDTIDPSKEETLGAMWYSRGDLQRIADETDQVMGQEVERGARILEGVWLGFLKEAGIIR